MRQRMHACMLMMLLASSLGAAVGCDSGELVPEARLEVDGSELPDAGFLRSIMLGLGADMDEISRGLWLEDLAIVDAAARTIAEHPHVSDTERMRIQGILGADFAEFIKGDRRVHDTALRLSATAAASDMTSTLDELAELQAGCVACHRNFRERLR